VSLAGSTVLTWTGIGTEQGVTNFDVYFGSVTP